jgi:membrane-bound lytic murein transglycosylase A
MPVPDARPSEKIARLFPQVDPLKDKPKDQKTLTKPSAASAAPATDAPNGNAAAKPATPVVQTPTAQAQVTQPVPLPEVRPNIQPSRDEFRRRRTRYRRPGR